MDRTALVWFRNDLRLRDNPALTAAIKTGSPVVALYVHESDKGVRPIGAAARWWLHHSLNDLAQGLAKLGIPLRVSVGAAQAEVTGAVQDAYSASVFWNRRYAPGERSVDTAIKTALTRDGVEVQSFAANVLVEPHTMSTGQGNPYSVYTPFWKSLRVQDINRPLPLPRAHSGAIPPKKVDADYRAPHWSEKFDGLWAIGEAGAHRVLERFLDGHVRDYPQARDIPAKDGTSRLSPHLRFGEISPRQIWHAGQSLAAREPELAGPIDKFLSELGWREFNYNQLYHRDDIATVPMQAKYAEMPWESATDKLERWQRGQTGFPIVDAGMRELWATGYMHNRVRMLVASLLSKNMLIDWRLGEQWFWDTLMDADVANNPGNWQWVAGSGLDASPYFRIFNPVTQGNRFDGEGDYVRQWVPELTDLPDAHVHSPSEAPASVLRAAGVKLGETYPEPIVDLKATRQRALEAAAAL